MEAIFCALSADTDMESLSLDSTCIKVHESANGGGKTADKAVGRTGSGLNKIQSCTLSWMDWGTRLNSCCLRGMTMIQSTLLNCWKM